MSAISVGTAAGPDVGGVIQNAFGVAGSGRPWLEVESALHLTRRGRLTVSAISAVALVMLGLAWMSTSLLVPNPAEAYVEGGVHVVNINGSDGAVLMGKSAPALVEHVVLPGETVWSMATTLAGDVDPRAYVLRIQKLNGLNSGSLHVGDVVLLPNGG